MTKYNAKISPLERGKGQRYQLYQQAQPLSTLSVLERLHGDADFRQWYHDLLRAAPYAAFFWEHPRFTRENLTESYEFVVVDSPSLARIRANPSPFNPYFQVTAPVVHFTSLRGDAELIVPNAEQTTLAYPSLADFVRTAPAEVVQDLWQKVGDLTLTLIERRDVFLSTSGLGVSWLHVRLDSRPKYYTHRAYRNS